MVQLLFSCPVIIHREILYECLENDVRAGRAGALSIRTWLSGKGVEIYEKITNLKCFYATDFTDLLSQ